MESSWRPADSVAELTLVKSKLLPPPPWKARVEALLERLPRRSDVPHCEPIAEVAPSAGGSGRWLSSGQRPMFQLEFTGGEVPHGWVYIEAALQRSMGNRVARLHFDRGDGYGHEEGVFIPSNLRGSIRELVHIPQDVVGIRWQPCEARGYFTQSPLVFHRVGVVERVVRMADRVATHRHLLVEASGERSRWQGLVHAYLAVRRLRFSQATASYQSFIAAQAAGNDRPGPAVDTASVAVPPHFVVHVGLEGESDIALAPTLNSLAAQQSAPYTLVDWRRPAVPRQSLANAWHLRLRAGDELTPDALHRLTRHLASRPAALVVYSDHDFLDAQGERCAPVFKPDWDPDLFYTHNYLGNLCAVSQAVEGADAALADRPSAAGMAALVLAADRHGGAEAITHLPVVLCHRREDPIHGDPYGGEPACLEALAGHAPLAQARIVEGMRPHTVRVVWPLRVPPAMVSVIIPTRDRVDLLRPCVDSLMRLTDYPDFEVIVVDNDSTDPQTAAYLADATRDPRVRVLHHAGAFNYSEINNRAAAQARGELLVFMNNDVEVIAPHWMSDMARQALRPGVGAVGAKLLYSDGSVQHAGVVMGIGGVAGHAHRFLPGTAPGYCGRAELSHSFTAVTAACLMVRKAAFDRAGGFDATHLRVAFNDVDLCLRLRRSGLRNLLEPRAPLYHHESMTRGADDTDEKRRTFEQERAYMLQHWPREIANDPAYNLNLSREQEDFSFRIQHASARARRSA